MRGVRSGSRSRPSRVERKKRRERDREAAAAEAGRGGGDAADADDERGSNAAAVAACYLEPAGIDDLLGDDSGEHGVAEAEERGRDVAAHAKRGRKVAAGDRARPPDAAIAARFLALSRPCSLCEVRFLTAYEGSFPVCARCSDVARAAGGAPASVTRSAPA